jgi:hypothetical protein
MRDAPTDAELGELAEHVNRLLAMVERSPALIPGIRRMSIITGAAMMRLEAKAEKETHEIRKPARLQ